MNKNIVSDNRNNQAQAMSKVAFDTAIEEIKERMDGKRIEYTPPFDILVSVELALGTWYPKNHALHLNPHHPLGKLLGKWGKLLDDYMKSVYKPSYKFNPIDELGDIWHCIRILAYQTGVKRKLREPYTLTEFYMPSDNIDCIICSAILSVSEAFGSLCRGSDWSVFCLDISYTAMQLILKQENITLQQLLE